MSQSVTDSGVIITGARGRLGTAMTTAFSDAGWQVWAANRSTGHGSAAGEISLDLSSDESIAAAISNLFDGDDLPAHIALVANASNREALSPDWESCGREQFHALMDVDVVGHFLLARALRTAALERGLSLSVLFVGSIYGLGGVRTGIYPGHGAFTTAVQRCQSRLDRAGSRSCGPLGR